MQSNHPSYHPSHQYTHSTLQQQNTTKDKPGLREFNPRQRPTHHQHTQSNHQATIHLTNTPIQPSIQQQNTQLQSNQAYGNLIHASGPHTINTCNLTTHTTTHFTNIYTHSTIQQQNTTTDNPGLLEFNPRQRPTHHQRTQSNHPNYHPSHQYILLLQN